jgi:hypothetical protein
MIPPGAATSAAPGGNSSVCQLPERAEQPIQLHSSGRELFRADVTPAHAAAQAHQHLAAAALGGLIPAATSARIRVRALTQVEQETIGGVTQLLSQLPIVTLHFLDQRRDGLLSFESEVESDESHR